MSSKKITFSIPECLYDGLKEHLSVLNDSYRVDDLFKCAAINRFIQIGYLDEFGQPISVPYLNIDYSAFPSWKLNNPNFKTYKE